MDVRTAPVAEDVTKEVLTQCITYIYQNKLLDYEVVDITFEGFYSFNDTNYLSLSAKNTNDPYKQRDNVLVPVDAVTI